MAAVDYFLKIDGIEGESPDHKHKGEIQLESWSFGESQGGTHSSGGGGGAGKVQMQDFHFVMKISKASPKLFLACACGQHIKKAVLVCRKAGKDQQEFLKTTFTDILVSSTKQAVPDTATSYRPIRFRSILRRSRSNTRNRNPTGHSVVRSRQVTT